MIADDQACLPRQRADTGSILPLILGFVVMAVLAVGGSVAAGNAFLHQSVLQDRCDAAAIGVGATALKTGRDYDQHGDRFDPVKLQQAITLFLQRDPVRRSLTINPHTASDGASVELDCAQNMPVALGFLFGRASITHHAKATTASPSRP